jgi:hypothetical protein
MSRGRPWSDERERQSLVVLRARKRMTWDKIAAVLDRSARGCANEFHRLSADYCASIMRSEVADRLDREIAGRVLFGAEAPAVTLAPAEIELERPRVTAPHLRRTSIAALQSAAEILGRIAERGITGGLLGDPAPGRSALDQKRGARP